MSENPYWTELFGYLEKGLDYTPIGRYASKLERRYGELRLRDKLLAEANYTIGSVLAGSGIYLSSTTGEIKPLLFTLSGLCIGKVGKLHQEAMGKKNDEV